MYNIVSKTHPSTNKPISHENFNKSTKNDLISGWAGSYYMYLNSLVFVLLTVNFWVGLFTGLTLFKCISY